MLKHVIIENFRSFGVTPGSRAASFDLAPLTVVVGDNSSGKSNILRALSFALSTDVDSISRTDFFIRKTRSGERKAQRIVISITAIEENDHETEIICTVRGSDRGGYEKLFKIDGRVFDPITITSPPDPELVEILRKFSVFSAPVSRTAEYLDRAKELLTTQTRSGITSTISRLGEEISRQLDSVRGHMSRSLGIEEVAIVPTVDIEKLLEAVNLKFAIEDEVSLPIENLGQGHISKATLKLAELLAGDCVICVEEPEIHVHPTGIKSLVKTFEELTASGKQVIITTHSPEIVNNSRYDSLLVVQKAIHRTSVDRIDPTQVGFSAEDAEEFQNIILRKRQRGDLFLSKYILLVEGEYDRLVLEALDRNGTLGLLEKDVTIVDMGGHGEFAKYHRILHRLNKPYVVLFDTAAISEVHQNATSKEGVGITTLKGDGTIGATHWTATNHTDFVRQTARARRGHIARLNQRIRSTDIGIVVHGHRDMTGIVKECWQKASVPEKLQLYKSLGGQNPNPTDREISNALNNAVDSKDMKMVQVVAGINPTAFGVLTDRINTALSRMFAE